MARHWLVMGLKNDSSPVDAHLSKMKATIENIASLAATNNLVVNQLMEHKAAVTVIAKAMFPEEPKGTTVMVKNVRHVVHWAVETLVDVPKQEERKLNLHLIGFEVKEGELKKELVQRLNIELLEGQMKLHAKVVIATQQHPIVVRTSALTMGTCLDVVLLKFMISEDHQAAL